MRIGLYALPIALLFSALVNVALSAQGNGAPHPESPHLEKRGAATQLIVDEKPFLMLSGELHNSSSSSLEYMTPIWPRLAAMGLNSVVTPLSWELIEPTEGSFDFTLVDGLLKQARAEHERIVFLWLASWKNGMSSYAPVWVKRDTRRFPRVVEQSSAETGKVEILSPQSLTTEEADARAFAALMQHIKQVDAEDHTVLMMQVENEVGVLGDSRDRSEAANKAFASPVPEELTRYLQAHRQTLYPDLLALWDANGSKTAGTWTEVFGTTKRADEIFMAWHYARFIQAVAAKGKAAYDLPMYVNTWLAGDDTPPGDYPSGGPEPWVVDVWKAAGQGLDFYAPDLYASNFTEWCKRYHRDGNPLYMPETRGGAAGAANVFYALGEEAGFGFSPFGIDSEMDDKGELAASYRAIASLAPLLLEHQGSGDVHGFVLDKGHSTVDFSMNGYTVHVALDEIFGHAAESGFGLIMATGKDEFLGVGKGFRVSFKPESPGGLQVGIAAVDEGTVEDGKWVPGRRLNGDENDQGKGWRFDPRQVKTEKVTLYRFE
jgi:beta-galactosidase GanA